MSPPPAATSLTNVQQIRAALAASAVSATAAAASVPLGAPHLQHVSFQAGNTRVFFPHEPYEPQRQYATHMIEAISRGYNAILESPTGTGKTLSLLCSSLAWIQNQTGVKSIIYYTSRTHLQLDQAAKEMKKTAYSRNPGVVLASRAHMCLNDDVRHLSADQMNRGCRNAIAKNACAYFSNYEQKLETVDTMQVHDIEDLLKLGHSKQLCPYYASKKIAETKANIIFMPYNYLLEPALNKSVQLRLDNSILIFDEAHNIENSLKEAVSGCFSQACLKTIRESCLKLPAKIAAALNQEKHGLSRTGYDPSSRKNASAIVDEFKTSKKSKKDNDLGGDKQKKVNPIEELAEKLTNEKLQQVNRCAEILLDEATNHMVIGNTTTVDKVLRVMDIASIKFETSSQIILTLESMASFWSIAGVMDAALVAKYVAAISNFSNFMSLLFPDGCNTGKGYQDHLKKLKNFYVAHFEGETAESEVLIRSNTLKNWKLNLWCLHPAIGLKRVIDSNCVKGPRSIIITSGTLAPITSIEGELELKFQIVKDFAHIIDVDQLKIMVLGQSQNGYSLKANHESTKKDEYSIALGKTLGPMYKVLPYGTLIFFGSYATMQRAIKYWKEKSTIWRDMNDASKVFVESRTSFDRDLNDYKKQVDQGGKAVFFGVCRGKLSEGVNLIGNQCRTLIMVGLPFPSMYDPKIKATKDFHSKKGDDNGNLWYTRQMTKALNQALGRIIRSKSDFGLLILCDPRFTAQKYCLSVWTRQFFPGQESKISEVQDSIKGFFSKHGIKIQETMSESCGAFEIDLSNPLSSWSSAEQARNYSASRPASVQSQAQSLNNLSRPQNGQVTQDSQRRPASQFGTFNSSSSSSGPPASHSSGQQSQQRARTMQELMQERQARMFGHIDEDPNEAELDIIAEPLPLSQPRVSTRPPRGPSPKRRRTTTTTTTTVVPSQSTTDRSQASSKEYSIVRESKAKNLPAGYKCEVCALQPADRPLRTNCRCARVGCTKCLKFLSKEPCKKCGKAWKFLEFKPLRFNSAFQEKHRVRL